LNYFAAPEPQSPDIDGGYSKWSDWSQCSASCGMGQTSRERVCNNPTPKGNGKPCYPDLGPAHQTTECHLMECPCMYLLEHDGDDDDDDGQ